MTTEIQKKNDIKALFQMDDVKQKFNEILGRRSASFITSIMQIVASNDLLKNADATSVYQCAIVSATLDLPLNNNLGFAYIVPYKQKQTDGSYKVVATFQVGYKGFIQLSQRSGQFQTISATPIYEGQLISENPLTGYTFDFTKKSTIVIGYAAYFKLINGFEKTLYMTVNDLKTHGGKYSQTFKKGHGLWKDEFDSMATKTVLKLLLSKFAPLSIDMQKAVIADQAVINDSETMDVEYSDNQPVQIDKEAERVVLMIQDSTDIEQLEKLKKHVKPEQMDIFKEKAEQLKPKQK
jgi:recombination protein RecT